jgi:3-hydroxybutyrate dehydrogenase
MRGKCALITGSTSGLGAATAARLAQEGCNIVLTGFGDPNAIEVQRRELEKTHSVRVLYHGADLSRPEEIAALMKNAIDAFGAVDILINNAVVRHFAPVHEFPVEAWDRSMAVNISAAFHTIRLAVPAMRARAWGRIINLSSIYGLIGATNRVDYVTSKTALIGMTRAVALENVVHGITCNAICPGSALTPSIEERIQALMAAESLPREGAVQKFLAGKQPSGEFVETDNVAALIAFLCGDAGRDITGAALPIDGGWSAS